MVSTPDVDNFKKLDEKWVSKTDFLDDTFEANVDARIVIHKDQQEEFTKFLGENGFEHRVLIENLETYVWNTELSHILSGVNQPPTSMLVSA